MTKRFDDGVERAWERFEVRLSSMLEELPENDEVSLRPADGPASETPYVVVVAQRRSFLAELSGNAVLGLSYQLNDAQERAARALGWTRPDEVVPSFHHDLPRDDVRVLVSLVAGTLRLVLGVPHPDFIAEPWTDVPDADVAEPGEAAADDEVLIGHPEGREELEELVRRTLDVLPVESFQDDDGDFGVVVGEAVVWVRVMPDRPVVHLFSFLVHDVTDEHQAAIELGILNSRQDYWKFTFTDGVIAAQYDLPAVPFVGPQLGWLVRQCAEPLTRISRDTRLRVGGELWWDYARRSQQDGSA